MGKIKKLKLQIFQRSVKRLFSNPVEKNRTQFFSQAFTKTKIILKLEHYYSLYPHESYGRKNVLSSPSQETSYDGYCNILFAGHTPCRSCAPCVRAAANAYRLGNAKEFERRVHARLHARHETTRPNALSPNERQEDACYTQQCAGGGGT